jgi:hypothetical protein
VTAQPTDADYAAARQLLSRRGFPMEQLPEVVAQVIADARAEGYDEAARHARDIATGTGAFNAAEIIRTDLIGEQP